VYVKSNYVLVTSLGLFGVPEERPEGVLRLRHSKGIGSGLYDPTPPESAFNFLDSLLSAALVILMQNLFTNTFLFEW
jgi:hypothetical protein